MFRKIFLILIFFLLASCSSAYADTDFDIKTQADYRIQENGEANVTATVTIENKKEFKYIPTYTVHLGLKDVREVSASDSQGSLETVIKESSDKRSIEVALRRTVGIGSRNVFNIFYTTSDLVRKKGAVREVNIPGISDPLKFSEYNITVQVPSNFSEAGVIKPYKKLTGNSFSFTRDEIGKSGILMLFGQTQYFTLDLTYHLVNSDVVPIKTEIALPPDTSYQEVRIESLDPSPRDVYRDADGNFLAVYDLEGREKKDIKAKVLARVYSRPVFDAGDFSGQYLSAERYWESNNPEIKDLAEKLKTPDAIYNYVVSTLTYNYDRLTQAERLGAQGVLDRPDFAVCLEFTDLFIALARAAGIPAREVEGYAFTDNSTLRPLSLVEDILHSWPEYYDSRSKTWVMVDPTWGNTTRGLDYFNTFDFDHIAFVVKGENSTYPIPAGGYKGGDKSKDVEVKLGGEELFTDEVESDVTLEFQDKFLAGFPVEGIVRIRNIGNVPIKNKKLVVHSDLTTEPQEFIIDAVLPYGSKTVPVSLSSTNFFTSRSAFIKASFHGSEIRKNFEIGFFPDSSLLILGAVITLGSLIVAGTAYKTWDIYFRK